MSKFSLPIRKEKADISVDAGKLETFAAGARDRRGRRLWDELDRKAPPRHNVSLRLNDYHLAMLQYVAEAMDTSQQKILRKHLVPLIESLTLTLTKEAKR